MEMHPLQLLSLTVCGLPLFKGISHGIEKLQLFSTSFFLQIMSHILDKFKLI